MAHPADAALPHVDLVDLIPFKQNLDRGLEMIIGRPYFGDGPITISPIIYGLLTTMVILGLTLITGLWRRSPQQGIIPDDRVQVRTVTVLAVEALHGLMVQVTGEERARRFLPLVGTLALFILLSNLMTILPGFQPPTGNLSVTVACGLVVFFTTHMVGLQEHGVVYLRHLFGPVIAWYSAPLMLLFLVIELIGQLARPLSLAMRLFGNIMADHLVVTMFVFLIPVLLPIPIMALSVLVAVVQTVVFSIISVIYIGMAAEHHEEQQPAIRNLEEGVSHWGP